MYPSALQALLHHRSKAVKRGQAVQGPAVGLGVELERERVKLRVIYPFTGAVVDIDKPQLASGAGQGGLVLSLIHICNGRGFGVSYV